MPNVGLVRSDSLVWNVPCAAFYAIIHTNLAH